MGARGFQGLFALTSVDADSAELYSITAAEVCRRSAELLITQDASFSPTLLRSGRDEDVDVDLLLDIGCGTCETTRMVSALLPRLAEVVAVDKSRKFLEFASAAAAASSSLDLRPATIEFIEMDVEAVPWPNGWRRKFTRVFSNYVLHWLKDHRKLLTNVAEVLVPGGELLMQFFHSTSGCENETAAALQAAEELGVSSAVKQFFGRYASREPEWRNAGHYSSLVASCGFDVVKCEVVERVVPLESLLERAGMALSVNPVISLLPEALRAKFAARYTEHLRDPLEIVHNVMVVHAFRKPAI